MTSETGVDVLMVGAHPDDVELGIGGLAHKLGAYGLKVGILDLTRGELSTRGSIEERQQESNKATSILGVAARKNAGLRDGGIENTHDQRQVVIPFIRSFRPRVLIFPMALDRHPDHVATHHLVRDSAYFSGLPRIKTSQEPFRPTIMYCYHPYFEDSPPPYLVVDVSDSFDTKMEALRAHKSQFYNPEYEGEDTLISSAQFWGSIETRGAYWGNRIGVKYGEPLHSYGPVGVVLPPGLGDLA